MKAFGQWCSWRDLKKEVLFSWNPQLKTSVRTPHSFANRDFPTGGLICEQFLLLLVLFNMHDTDNDGTITLEEYRKVSEQRDDAEHVLSIT